MIEIVKDIPFKDCEICQAFELETDQTRMFGDDMCIIHEIIITCSRYKVCRDIRRHLESKKEGNA